ncbi:MAG: glucokinase [Myxococcota bacterium]|jgi:glucokinase
MKYYVGIDVGGTRLKAGLVDEKHKIHGERVVELTAADKTEEGMIAKLADVTRAVLDGKRPVVVGLGVAGLVHRWKGTVVTAPNFPDWDHFRIKERLEAAIGLHVVVDNDANCVITGEYLQGAGAGHPDLLGITLGTGVGGALILGGSLWHGANGMAGEFGHMTVDPNGPRCGCGNTGCLEMYAGRVGLAELVRKRPVKGCDPDSTDVPAQLLAAAEAGDTQAKDHFKTAGRALGRALGGVLNLLNLQTVCIAGGVAPAFVYMEDACRQEMRRVAFGAVCDDVQFVIARLGPNAGILGAAMQWMMMPHD